jgi:thioredoxin-like negative regulator of GroEL
MIRPMRPATEPGWLGLLNRFVRGRRGRTAVLAIALATPAGAALADGLFLQDPREAFRRAGDEQLPMLIEFHTNWCRSCERMQRETWPDPRLREPMRQFVALSIDGDRERNLVSRYRIEGYPTIVLTASGGEPVLELRAFQDAEAMAEHLAHFLDNRQQLGAWARSAAGPRPDPEALIGLAKFTRERGSLFQAEGLYRKALRRAGEPASGFTNRARTGLADVLVAAYRCREALKLIAKLDPSPMRDGVEARARKCVSR